MGFSAVAVAPRTVRSVREVESLALANEILASGEWDLLQVVPSRVGGGGNHSAAGLTYVLVQYH